MAGGHGGGGHGGGDHGGGGGNAAAAAIAMTGLTVLGTYGAMMLLTGLVLFKGWVGENPWSKDYGCFISQNLVGLLVFWAFRFCYLVPVEADEWQSMRGKAVICGSLVFILLWLQTTPVLWVTYGGYIESHLLSGFAIALGIFIILNVVEELLETVFAHTFHVGFAANHHGGH